MDSLCSNFWENSAIYSETTNLTIWLLYNKSRHISMLFLLSDPHHPTAVLLLLHPQQKKDLKALHLWASLSWSLFRQTGQKMHVKQIRRNVWVHPTETDLFSKYKRGFLSLLAHTFWKWYTAGALILRFLCSSSWRIKGCLLEYIFPSKKVVIIRKCGLYKPLAEDAHVESGNFYLLDPWWETSALSNNLCSVAFQLMTLM